MKITFVTTGDIQSIATSKRAFGMVEPLTKLGYQVSILIEDTPNNRLRMEQEAPNSTTLWFKPSKAINEVKLKHKILKQLAPDFVYISALGVRNFAWNPVLAKKSIFLIEHSELASSIKNQSLARRTMSLLFEKLSLFLFDGHIVASNYLKEHITNDLSRLNLKRSIHYSPYAYTPSMLITDPIIDHKVKKCIGDAKLMVYMGTLSKNYGILDIVNSFYELQKKHSDVKLFVLGKGRDKALVEELIGELGLQNKIKLKGYVPDAEMPSYLEAADLFISPLYDTIQDIARCPSKLFLYLPFNKPIVTNNIGEASSLFGNDYEFYFKSGDINSMASTLNHALELSSCWVPSWRASDHSWARRSRDMHNWLDTLINSKKG